MKKHVEFINVKLSFLKWLLQKLEDETEALPDQKEIEQSVVHLINGTSASLMIETDQTDKVIQTPQSIIQCGDLKINVSEHRVTREGKEIFLTPKEFDILCFLARNKGIVFTKEQIYQAVWDKDYLLDDSNIMAFIRKIRKKIEKTPDEPEYILTIWGIGYKFNDNL